MSGNKEKDVVENTRRTFSSIFPSSGNIFKPFKAQTKGYANNEGVKNPFIAILIVAGAILATVGLVYIISLFITAV
ncbi:MAG: hypothetical protein LIR50_21260 [Bacillota bacterium]|nr:hypothetical protein [Bacillota bacterium]